MPSHTPSDSALRESAVPRLSLRDRLRTETGRRTFGIGLTLLVEALLLLLLLSLGTGLGIGDKKEGRTTVINLAPEETSEESPETDKAAPEQKTQERPVPKPPRPLESKPVPAQVIPAPPPQQPRPVIQLPPSPVPSAPSGRVYGPPSPGRSASLDTERVGTAPNGEPLYAAAWYRKPTDAELGGYMSTANGPGWGLIACRTAPGFRVEDCVGLDEYPDGSQINRAVLAAAWQFKVRPPMKGGVSLVGSWVRIRIDYGIKGR